MMHKNVAVPVIISVLITAIVVGGVVGGGVYLWQNSLEPSVSGNHEEEKNTLLEQNDILLEQVNTLEEEKENLLAQLENSQAQHEETRNFKPKPGWEDYFPEPDETTLEGMSVPEVSELLGEPPVKIRSDAASPEHNREIWIFMPFDEDPTGLYLYFKGNQLWSSRIDEFNGLHGSGLLQDEAFWME